MKETDKKTLSMYDKNHIKLNYFGHSNSGHTCILFSKLKPKTRHMYLRIIMFMYINQFSNVRWHSELS